MQKSIWICLCILFSYNWIKPAIACSERAVVNAIFDDYDNRLRPVKNQSTVTTVYVNTQTTVLSIEEQKELIELMTTTYLSWTDEYLQWNATDFDGCESITMLASSIWIPDYVILNQIEIKDTGMDDFLFAHIYSNGRVDLIIPRHGIITCPMDITYFPFDTQICQFVAGSWRYPSRSVVFRKNMDGVRDEIRQNTSEFETVSFTSEEKLVRPASESFTILRYSLVLKRRPEYYVFVLVIPSFLLTMLCIIGIFTPNSSEGERNEKMTLGLTTLLSMAVILNITADEMPKSATGLPLLGYYILYEIGVCALSTIFSTILICIHERAKRNHWSPPTIIRWIASIPSPLGCIRWITGLGGQISALKNIDKISTSKARLHNEENVTLELENPSKTSIAKTEENEILASLRQMNTKIDEYIKSCDEDEERKFIWASALHHIDFFLLVVLLSANCALTASIMFRG